MQATAPARDPNPLVIPVIELITESPDRLLGAKLVEAMAPSALYTAQWKIPQKNRTRQFRNTVSGTSKNRGLGKLSYSA